MAYIGNTKTLFAQGKDGKSAYELAVENGFTGTEEEYLQSLVGTDGVGTFIFPEQLNAIHAVGDILTVKGAGFKMLTQYPKVGDWILFLASDGTNNQIEAAIVTESVEVLDPAYCALTVEVRVVQAQAGGGTPTLYCHSVNLNVSSDSYNKINSETGATLGGGFVHVVLYSLRATAFTLSEFTTLLKAKPQNAAGYIYDSNGERYEVYRIGMSAYNFNIIGMDINITLSTSTNSVEYSAPTPYAMP